MVAATDLKCYRSTGDLGGAITGTQIPTSTPNNLFTNIPINELVVGEDYYKCCFFKNTHATESMDNFKLWLSNGTPYEHTDLKWAFDFGVESVESGFFNGTSDYISVPDSSSLDLNQFSIAVRFKTSKDYSLLGTGGEGILLMKGYFAGPATPGTEMNYGIWVTDLNHLRGGFEQSDGTDHFVNSITPEIFVNDGVWHLAVLTYSGTIVRLYLDGVEIDTHVTSATPDTGSIPLEVGRNPYHAHPIGGWYQGEIDYAYVWNNDLTAGEVSALSSAGTIPQVANIVYSKTFDTTITPEYKYAPYFTADGSTYDETADAAQYDVTSSFTVSAWFRTLTNFADTGVIVNKGGFNSETAGQNMNWGIWMTANEKIQGGFEDSAGADKFAISTASYNDGLWHFAVVRYNATDQQVKLWVDDMATGHEVGTASTGGAIPDTGANPIRIGANSRALDSYFTGQIDEVRMWNRSVNESERIALMTSNTVSTTNLQFEKKFGADTNAVDAQTIADKYTSPVGVTWNSVGTIPTTSEIGSLTAGEFFPIWLWLHVDANSAATPATDDNGIFTFDFFIPPGGTGTPGTGGSGGGTGGNPPPTPTDWKIAIVGDEGCEPETDDVISLINTNAYDYVVSVGDHAYESASCWTSKFSGLKSKMISAYGNHEYSESGGTSPYKTFLGRNSTYYTFKFQNILFIVIDDNDFEDGSAPSLSVGSTQHNFIKSALTAAANDNTIVWKIAIIHHPWFGTGADHPSNEGGQVGELHELFQNNKVSFVCVGHNHNWQRSFQVSYDSATPQTPNIVASTSPYSRNVTGLIHVVTGTGGHDSGGGLYGLPNTDSPNWQAYQNRTHNGVWEIVATNSGNTLTCSFVEIGGDKFDTFVITA